MQEPFDSTEQREFRCDHCQGLIRVPANLPATTGPCPHCGESITSPSPDGEPSPEQHSESSTEPKSESSTEANESPFLIKGQKIRSNPEEDDEEENQETRRSYLAAALGLLSVVAVIAVGATLALKELKKTRSTTNDEAVADSVSLRESHYIRTGWKKEAYQVLGDFMKGTSAQEKIPHVHFGESLAEKIHEFYGEGTINDSDTPAEAFSIFNLSEEDRKRGLFMLVFDQPPQFSMRDFFRPLASLEVQYGLVEADMLLTSMARVSNFATDPMRVHAFFKKTSDGLKLDWDIFTQTKYNLLRNFLEAPRIGQKKVFRVFIMEDVPDERFSIVTTRTYRIADPANTDHFARILVPTDSDVGRQLAPINWIGTETTKQQTRTATVELEWRGQDKQAYLAIGQFMCWEFLGLGGQKPVAKPKDSERENP